LSFELLLRHLMAALGGQRKMRKRLTTPGTVPEPHGTAYSIRARS